MRAIDRPFYLHLGFLVSLTLVATALLVTSCESKPQSLEHVSLAALIRTPKNWEGKRVEVEGTLHQFREENGSSYGVVEDSVQNRIGIRNITPWRSLAGRQVVAKGTVNFDPSFGWFLEKPTLMASAP